MLKPKSEKIRLSFVVMAVIFGLQIVADGQLPSRDSLVGSMSFKQLDQDKDKFDFDKYEIGTLRQIINYHPTELPSKTGIPSGGIDIISAKTLFIKARVTYTGMLRDIKPAKKRLISDWAKSLSVNPTYVALFTKEFLFLEGKDKHWLPIQNHMIHYFQEEMKAGEQLDLYTVWLGSFVTKEIGKPEWVFLVNEFQKVEKQSAPPQKSPTPGVKRNKLIARL